MLLFLTPEMKTQRCLLVGAVVLLGWLGAIPARAQEDRGVWSKRAPLPTPRQEVPHVVLDGKVYVPGGIDAQRQGTRVVEVYDPATDTWTTTAPLPLPLHHLGAAAVRGKLYVLGGYQGNTFVPTSRVFAYDPATDTWAERTPMPTARGAHAAVAFEDEIYVFGGAAGGLAVGIHQVYDPEADAWSARAAMPTPSEHLAAARLDSLIYVVGGRAFEDGSLTNLRDLQVYRPRTDTWQRLALMPTARGGLAAAAASGRLYVFGGETFEGGGGVFPENEAYDPATDTWQTMAPMPVPRHGIGAATVDGAIYVIGGGPVAGFSTSAENSVFVPPPTPTAYEADALLPERAALYPNFPNPFRSVTTIRFAVPVATEASLTVYDVLGRAVATLLEGRVAPGVHAVRWEARRQPGGVYLCRLWAGRHVAIRPLTLLR